MQIWASNIHIKSIPEVPQLWEKKEKKNCHHCGTQETLVIGILQYGWPIFLDYGWRIYNQAKTVI